MNLSLHNILRRFSNFLHIWFASVFNFSFFIKSENMFHKNKKKSESLGFKSPRMTRCVGLVNSYRSWK